MEGSARAATRQQQRDIWRAWHIAAFTGAASVGKLRAFETYIKPVAPAVQTAAEMLAVLEELKSSGAPIDIRKVN